MKKVFRKKTDHLRVTITQEDKILLPLESGQSEVGTYEQVTNQKIELSKVPEFREYIYSEREKVVKQINETVSQLVKFKEVEDSFTEEFMTKATESLSILLDKARYEKAEVKEVPEGEDIPEPKQVFDKEAHDVALQGIQKLDKTLGSIQQKRALTKQVEFFEEQLARMDKDLKDLDEAMAV